MRLPAAAAVCFLGLWAAGAPAFAAAAKVLEVQGEALVRHASTDSWTAASKGQSLPEGAELRTSENSICEVGFVQDGRGSVRLQAKTHVRLSSIHPRKFELIEGRVFTLIRELEKGSELRIASPTSIASARGTGWEQSFYEVLVYEDVVHVEGSGGARSDVNQGHGIHIGEDGALSALFELTPEQLETWKAFSKGALAGLDGLESTEEVPEIGEFDPTDQVMASKDEFDDLNDFEEEPQREAEATTGGGSGTGGTNL